jgi:hypothetical protein
MEASFPFPKITLRSVYRSILGQVLPSAFRHYGVAETLSPSSRKEDLPEHFINTLKEDIRRLIALLEDDSPNPQSLHESVPKFISNVTVHRETKIVHITFQIKSTEEVLYQKILVTEWPKK